MPCTATTQRPDDTGLARNGEGHASAPFPGGPVVGRVAVIDIGSNSVRLVVFAENVIPPLTLFNDKATCRLGQGLSETGRLHEASVEHALNTIGRFATLVQAYAPEHVLVMATAAARTATNGPAFIRAVEARLGGAVRVLTGEEEARLSTQGLLLGQPRADGVAGDLGGGSLELTAINTGDQARRVSLPLGCLRLADIAGRRGFKAAVAFVDAEIGGVETMVRAGRGRTFYAIGGTWRAFARACMKLDDHPLAIVQGYALPAERAHDHAQRIARDNKLKLDGIPKRRLELLPYAALLVERIVEHLVPKEIVFSAYGLREGAWFDAQATAISGADVLRAGCLHLYGLFPFSPDQAGLLRDWLGGLVPALPAALPTHLIEAACLLSHLPITKHPEYRAEDVFLRVMRSPALTLRHEERAFLALTCLWAAGGRRKAIPGADRIGTLLTEEVMRSAKELGYAFRLARTLTGGAENLLRLTSLRVEDDRLTLEAEGGLVIPPGAYDDLIDLADLMGRKHTVREIVAT